MSSPILSDAKRLLLEECLRGGALPPRAISPAASTGPVPLSAGQRQIWIHGQVVDLPIYNEPVTVLRHGPLDPEVLGRVLSEIVRRHHAWRTAFHLVDGRPVQAVVPPFAVELPVDDLRNLPREAREERSLAIGAADAALPFDLRRPPLFRGRIVRMGEEEFRLHLTLHHLIFDTVSLFQVFLPELASLYDAAAGGGLPRLADPPAQHADFVRWEEERPLDARALAYWREKLRQAPPPLGFPLHRSRSTVPGGRGAMRRTHLAPPVVSALRKLAAEENVTLFAVIFAGITALFHRYSGQDDFLLGTVSSVRPGPEFERVMGYFLNTIVLRASAGGDPSFRQLVRRSSAEILGAVARSDVPFETVAGETTREAMTPLVRALVSFEPPGRDVGKGWEIDLFSIQSGASKFDLSIELEERSSGIGGRFIYDADRFEPDEIEALEACWRRLLAVAVSTPDRPLSGLEPLGDDARTVPEIEVPREATIDAVPAAFSIQARRTPGAAALRADGGEVTYADLDRRVRSMAAALRRRGVERETRVGVCLPRSADLIAVLLAIGRAGGAYVALDPEWPPARLSAVAADADPALIVADHAVAGFPSKRIVSPSDLALDPPGEPELAPRPLASDLAYVLYTSGSTGAPKGVMVEHGSVSNLLSWSQRVFPLDPGSRVLQKAPIGFDASVWEIFAPLVAGATLVLAPEGAERDPAALALCIRDERITHLKLVPSLLRMLLATPEFGACTALEHVFCGGEELTGNLAEAFHGRMAARLHNLYGPTETCVDVAFHSCRPEDRGRVPIGLPIDNTHLLVLGPSGRTVPTGFPGELAVAGAALARGYLGREDLTRERFVASPADPSVRLYRTGDRVRRRPDGELEFLGRVDDQIKIRGVRIEPGEIEEALRTHPGVARAIVLAREAGDHPSLVAWVESEGPSRPVPAELRAFVASRLPRALVPDVFVVLDALPLTSSGKIDRSALPAPDRSLPGDEGPAPPSTAEERLLASIWSEVLGVGPVGTHDNLFDLGGNSLLVFQITARAARAGYPITPRQLFEHPTVAELARAAGPLLRDSADPSRRKVAHG